MNRKMTLLAFAGKSGALGANVAAAASRCSRNPAANAPNPRPDFSRNSRREEALMVRSHKFMGLLNVQEFVHIQQHQAEIGHGLLFPFEETRRLLFLRR